MIFLIKRILRNDSYLYRLLSFLYAFRHIYWKPPIVQSLQELIDIYLISKTEVLFIQVGSNDGISNDPLHNYIVGGNWSGYCIEPLKENIKKLKQNYSAFPQVQIIEAAVGDDGVSRIFSINPLKANQLDIAIPDWHSQLASFDRDLVVSDIKGSNKYEILDEVHVLSVSFLTVIDRFKIHKLDLLHIDAEGTDWMILRSFPFKHIKPEVIIFEHNHLSEKDYKNAVFALQKFGYGLLRAGTDTFCYSKTLSNYYSKVSKHLF